MDEYEFRAIAALLLLVAVDSPPTQKRKQRKHWVQPWTGRRRKQCCYENLMRELALEDSEGYRRWIRMDTDTFYEILDSIKNSIERQDTRMRQSITAGERLAITLRFLATGETFKSLSHAFRAADCTIGIIVPDVCKAIVQVLGKKYLKPPASQEDWKRIAEMYEQLWNFPHCIGAIDGKHIEILPSLNSGSAFYNYKGFFSIVLLAAVDADLKFIYVDIGTNGINDGSLWNKCSLKHAMENGSINLPDPSPLTGRQLPVPYTMVGDDAFSLKTYLMKPYPGSGLDGNQRIFNYRLSRARRCAENAFGLLVSRWRVYTSAFRIPPEKATVVSFATFVLHNMLRTKSSSRHIYSPPCSIDIEDPTSGVVTPGEWRTTPMPGELTAQMLQMGNHSSATAIRIRNEFQEYFIGPGSVSWQEKCCCTNL